MASQQLVLAGGNNVTLSQSEDAQSLSATVTMSGGNSYSIGITSLGNTSGNTGLVSQQVVLVGGNNVTLSESINAGSATVTISMGAAGAVTFSAGVSSGGNTLGNTGVVSNRLVFAGGDNITLSQSTNANSATMTISIANAVIPTISYWNNMINEGNVISNHDSFFNLVYLDPKNNVFPGNMTVSTVYFPISVPSISTSQLTYGFLGTLKLGIYTRNASTLSIHNSVQTTWSYSSVTDISNTLQGLRWLTINSSQWSASPTFSNTEYYLGYIMHLSAQSTFTQTLTFGGSTLTLTLTGQITGISAQYPAFTHLISSDIARRSGTFGLSLTSGNTSMGWVPFIGESGASRNNTAALPTSILLGALSKGGTQYGVVPQIVFNNISSNF